MENLSLTRILAPDSVNSGTTTSPDHQPEGGTMKRLFAIVVTLFLFVFALIPTASAGDAELTLAVAKMKVDSVSRVSEAYAAAYADETMTREELMVKAAAKTADLERVTGVYNAEYKHPVRDEHRLAILTIQVAVMAAELKFINLRLARFSSKDCVIGKCKPALATAYKEMNEGAQAKDAYAKALNTIRLAVP